MMATASANPGYKIISTGHSLGAAVATLAAAEFRNQGLSVDLVCFSNNRHDVLL
jgi:thioesterase domain-containing protein